MKKKRKGQMLFALKSRKKKRRVRVAGPWEPKKQKICPIEEDQVVGGEKKKTASSGKHLGSAIREKRKKEGKKKESGHRRKPCYQKTGNGKVGGGRGERKNVHVSTSGTLTCGKGPSRGEGSILGERKRGRGKNLLPALKGGRRI